MYKGGINISEKDCERIIRNIKDGYPRLSTWQKDTVKVAKYRGYTRSRTGRRRYLKDIKSKDWNKRAVSERCALNTPIQGTAKRYNKNSYGKNTKGITRKGLYKTTTSNT